MTNLEIFDPPMCCETGICGQTIDPNLPRFAADIEWLKSRGAAVERFNLAQQPGEFVARSVVKNALAVDGNACLPMILVNGQIASRGVYPAREQLAALAGFGDAESQNSGQKSRPGRSIPVLQNQGGCEPDAAGNSSCC